MRTDRLGKDRSVICHLEGRFYPSHISRPSSIVIEGCLKKVERSDCRAGPTNYKPVAQDVSLCNLERERQGTRAPKIKTNGDDDVNKVKKKGKKGSRKKGENYPIPLQDRRRSHSLPQRS